MKYCVEMDTGQSAKFKTITECRAFAESYGTTSNSATIRRVKSRKIVALHRRDTSGNGLRWYKAVGA